MSCPKCKNNASEIVIDSRETKLGYRRRRKRCLNCDYRWTTVEITEVQYKALKRTVSALKTAFFEARNLEV